MSHYLYLGSADPINMTRAKYVRARVRVAEYRARAVLTTAARNAIDKLPISSSLKSKLKQTPIEGVLELLNPIEGMISDLGQRAYARANPMAKQAVDRLPRTIDAFTRRLYNAIRFLILTGMDPMAMGLAMAQYGLPPPGQVAAALLTGAKAAVQGALTQGREAVTSVFNQFGISIRGAGNLGHYAYLGASEFSSDATMTSDPNATAGAQPDADVTGPPAGDPVNGGESPTVTENTGTQNSGNKDTAKSSGILAIILGALITPDMIKLLMDLVKVGMVTTVQVATGGRVGGSKQTQQPPPATTDPNTTTGPGIMSMKVAGIPLPVVAGGALVAFLALRK